MAFTQLGTPSQLQFKIPTKNTTNWSDQLKSDFFQKLVEHDHSGTGGRGTQLASGAIQDNAINQVKIRLDNATFLRSRNAADTGDVSLIGANADDKIVFGTDIAVIPVDDLRPKKTSTPNTHTITSDISTTILTGLPVTNGYAINYKISYNNQMEVGTLTATGDTTSREFVGTYFGFNVDFAFAAFPIGDPSVFIIDTTPGPSVTVGNPVTFTYTIEEL